MALLRLECYSKSMAQPPSGRLDVAVLRQHVAERRREQDCLPVRLV